MFKTAGDFIAFLTNVSEMTNVPPQLSASAEVIPPIAHDGNAGVSAVAGIFSSLCSIGRDWGSEWRGSP